MLVFVLILLFVIDVKGYPQSMQLINSQHQQILFNKISSWILLREKRNSNDTRKTYHQAIDQNIDDYYIKKKGGIILEKSITSIPKQTPTIPTEYRDFGNCSDTEKNQLLYQHNLGIGLQGSSQLNANFQVILDGPIVITCVKVFPYNNTEGTITWLSGGPGKNYVKLSMRALNNKGVSYIIKIWGMKK